VPWHGSADIFDFLMVGLLQYNHVVQYLFMKSNFLISLLRSAPWHSGTDIFHFLVVGLVLYSVFCEYFDAQSLSNQPAEVGAMAQQHQHFLFSRSWIITIQ
jgi:hypothetical protein